MNTSIQRVALAVAACLAGAAGANAQSAGITMHTLDPAVAEAAFGAGEPAGPVLERLPLVDPSVFLAAERLAAGAEISGIPGADGEEEQEADGAEPEAFGAAKAPYTTARVAVTKLGLSKKAPATPVTSFPYRATGKLYMKFGAKTFVCTASLIKKGVLVTAAHCVHNFGQGTSGFADAVTWVPAQFAKKAAGKPFGAFKAINVFVPTPYVDGTDTCTQSGVVCNNDVATVVLGRKKVTIKKKKVWRFAGQVLGVYRYGWNGFSYVVSPLLGNTRVVQLTQLGYPVAFDGGLQMQRTDAVGWFIKDGALKNTQIGSAQTGGSSGGPWLANFGTRPKVKAAKASLGKQPAPNIVLGVTSYGAAQKGFNRQGASFFGQNVEYPNTNYGGYGAGNIGALVQQTCTLHPKHC